MKTAVLKRLHLSLILLLAGIYLQAQGRSTSSVPVMFDSVRISLKNEAIQVQWSNLTERDLVDYVVERSADARTFTPITRTRPKSNRNEPMSYSEVDPTPLDGLNYYRIRVTTTTGKIIHSITLKIETSHEGTDLSIYPNPCITGQLGWSVSNLPVGNYQLAITGMHGLMVFQKAVRIQGKGYTGTIDLPAGLKAGLYQLTLRGDAVELARRFIVQ